MSRINVANFRHPDATADSITVTSDGDTQINRALGLGGATYGTSGQVLTSGGSGAVPTWTTPTAGLTWNTLADNVSVGTGGAKTISGIDSNAKKVIMTFKNVSLNTDDAFYHMVGSGALNGTYAATGGYYGTGSASGGEHRTDYFKFTGNGASYAFHGIIEYTYHGDNEWLCVSHQIYSQPYTTTAVGKVDLPGTLDRIALGGLGASVFDAGQLSVFELV